MIPVTQPHLPNRAKLQSYIDGIYERGWLTNNGPLVQELEARLAEYLGVSNLLLVSNGTLALQVAFKALGVHNSAVTTPFSFVATTSALQWEGIKPVFADIDAHTLCLDPAKAEAAMTPDVDAIVPVHVFGNACDVETLDEVAQRRGVQLIYDASHAFGVNYQDESLLAHGDAATLSFHATKLFHSVEGGAVIFKREEDLDKARRIINFGYDNGEINGVGINAKMSEFHAAMGLCMLDEIETIQPQRARLSRAYHELLEGHVQFPVWHTDGTHNHAYFPVLFEDEATLLRVQQSLRDRGIMPRRYFHPSLDTLVYVQPQTGMPVSRDVAGRILCLPLYVQLEVDQVVQISQIIKASL